MTPLAIPYPGIDPVAFSLGPFDVRWYGLAYAAGLILAWLYIRALIANRPLWSRQTPPFAPDRADDLVLWVMLAVVLGGRLGHVLLYEPTYYAANPDQILAVWKGGMSFHGALVGSAIGIVLFARHYRVAARSVMDLCCTGIAFGLVIGRLANFANSEHWGRVTDVPWGMVFPNGGPEPRHPSQLYEAALEGLVMIVLIRLVTHTWLGLRRPGLVTGVWLVWYAIARTICEVFREPEAVHALNVLGLTAGQLYSLPMLVLGIYFIATARDSAGGDATAAAPERARP